MTRAAFDAGVRPGVRATALLVAKKELRSALRDRQTLLYTVALPLLLYPVLFWILIQGLTVLRGQDAATTVHATVSCDDAQYERLRPVLAIQGGTGETAAPGAERVEWTRAAERLDASAAQALLFGDHAPDAVLWFDADEHPVLAYESTKSRSVLAVERIRKRWASFTEELREKALDASGTSVAALTPFELVRANLASEEDLSGFFFSFILPMTFVLMAVMGAFYPAVDCTAGEKERGTAETTLLLPPSRVGVQLGRILAVAVAALVATVLNLAGLTLAAEPLLAAAGKDLAITIPWGAFALAIPMCAGFLVVASAILVALASFTNTFKQGQALLGVVQVAFLVPAVLGAMPGVELTTGLAFVPVLQTVLAFKAILSGFGAEHGPGAAQLVIVFVTQLVYAALATLAAVRISSRESLLLGGVSIRRALALWRTEGAPR